MKYFCFLIAIFLATTAFGNERLVFSGVYQGSDLYVQNPFSGQGVSFCVFEVRINGEVTSDEVNSSAFVVDMAVMGINVGDEVEIVINHKKGCEPRVLNPEVLNPRSTFEVKEIGVSEDRVLSWTTTGEAGELPYYVEQFKWNKWVKVGEVTGKGTPQEHVYEFKLTPHSGTNSVRVRQSDYRGESRTSAIVEYEGSEQPITFGPDKPREIITFSNDTGYEIFDEYGNLVKKGHSNRVDIANIEKGKYYLNYDHSFGETFKKR